MIKNNKMKVIFLDNDGVICLSNNWGGRMKKWEKYKKLNPEAASDITAPVDVRFDHFDKKAIKVLNQVLEETGAEIVVSSDWRVHANLEELGEYYLAQGILKKPIGVTKKLGDCDQPENFIWSRQWGLEQSRSLEIKQYLRDHPEVTEWVAVDDLDMSNDGEPKKWGLTNFVLTPRKNEGIKQSGVKEKIINYLTNDETN
jgi:hypothetical protein